MASFTVPKDFGFGTEFSSPAAFRQALRTHRPHMSADEVEEAFIMGRDAARAQGVEGDPTRLSTQWGTDLLLQGEPPVARAE